MGFSRTQAHGMCNGCQSTIQWAAKQRRTWHQYKCMLFSDSLPCKPDISLSLLSVCLMPLRPTYTADIQMGLTNYVCCIMWLLAISDIRYVWCRIGMTSLLRSMLASSASVSGSKAWPMKWWWMTVFQLSATSSSLWRQRLGMSSGVHLLRKHTQSKQEVYWVILWIFAFL